MVGAAHNPETATTAFGKHNERPVIYWAMIPLDGTSS